MKFLKILGPSGGQILLGAFILIFTGSCATYHQQQGKNPVAVKDDFSGKGTIAHTFFLVGDVGNADKPKAAQLLNLLQARVEKSDTNSTLLFLGDNVYPRGIPPQNHPDRDDAEQKLALQLQITKKFKGRSLFIPGNHDWYNGLDGLNEQEKLVNAYSDKTAFLPQKGCAIQSVPVNESAAMIVVDSEWYLEKWDRYPNINADCDIKTREQFFEELEDQLIESQNKATLLIIHHPLMTNGSHGGEYPLQKHLFPLEQDIPLPLIGTLVNVVRKTSGALLQDLQNKKYNELVKRIITLVRERENVVVVSAHDHNLQYIEKDNIKQIISGAGSKSEAARAINNNDFSYGRHGYAMLQVRKDGAAKVSYFSANDGTEKLIAERQPLFARPKPDVKEYPSTFAATKDTSVYTTEMATKGRVYRLLWGNHYRKQYGTTIKIAQVNLDTLYGGLKPTLADADALTKSLLLEDKKGKNYTMRPIKKSATRFLQSVAFKDQSIEKAFKNTYTEDVILDFYTTAHPFMPLVAAKLAQRADVVHTNPKLLYVPKQRSLGTFNENFGNELYLIEEVPTDASRSISNFGKPSAIVSTDEVLANLILDKKYQIDEKAYIRARIFDMLIGDWETDPEQWYWGAFNIGQNIIYRPIPFNRDHAFTKFDGLFFKVIMNFPKLRHMKTYSDELKKINWFNRNAYAQDIALLPNATKSDWIQQAELISKELTDKEIDNAFLSLPPEVRDEASDQLVSQLKARKRNLNAIATSYFEVLQKTVLITGSESNDRFRITREDKATIVEVYQIDGNSESLTHKRTYSSNETNELWIYGMSGDDLFEVAGNGRKKLLIRLMGSQGNDTYKIDNGKRIKIYDFSNSENDLSEAGNARKVLTTSYDLNNYAYDKPKYDFFSGFPSIGFNPDDGVKLGGVAKYSINSFRSYPLLQTHSIGGNYYFATGGYEFSYRGIFPHSIGKWDFIVDALYTSPNFSINFFGYGNETDNQDDELGKDYNRVKIRTVKAGPSLRWIGEQGASAVFKATFERNRVERSSDRIIAETASINPEVFQYQNFVDINAKYSFENYDNPSNPTLGMTFSLLGGYKLNIDKTQRNFPYAEGLLGFNYRLIPSGDLVLATIINGRMIFNDDFEFYQASTVGGDFGLRGFRNQRFTGKHSAFHSTDLRLNLGKLKNGLAPLHYGVFGGFDYGRVWLENDASNKWHQSVGGGIWLNGVNLLTVKGSYFYSTDGGRVSVGLGFGF